MASTNPGWSNGLIPPRAKEPEPLTEEGRRRMEIRRRVEDAQQAIELGKLLDNELYVNDLWENQ